MKCLTEAHRQCYFMVFDEMLHTESECVSGRFGCLGRKEVPL